MFLCLCGQTGGLLVVCSRLIICHDKSSGGNTHTHTCSFKLSQTHLGLHKHFSSTASSPSHVESGRESQKQGQSLGPSHTIALTNDFLCHYATEFRGLRTGPVASVLRRGYERTGNWAEGCLVTTLGIYITSGGGKGRRIEVVRVKRTPIKERDHDVHSNV